MNVVPLACGGVFGTFVGADGGGEQTGRRTVIHPSHDRRQPNS